MHFRLCESDRAEYGGPEWFAFDAEDLVDMRASKLTTFETTLGRKLSEVLTGMGADDLRARLWLGRHLAGVVEEYEAFDPRVFAVETSRETPKETPDPEPSPTGPPLSETAA